MIFSDSVLLFLPIDINECELGINNCDVNANCSNTFGTFECTCSAGFVGDGVNCTSKELHCHICVCKVMMCTLLNHYMCVPVLVHLS